MTPLLFYFYQRMKSYSMKKHIQVRNKPNSKGLSFRFWLYVIPPLKYCDVIYVSSKNNSCPFIGSSINKITTFRPFPFLLLCIINFSTLFDHFPFEVLWCHLWTGPAFKVKCVFFRKYLCFRHLQTGEASYFPEFYRFKIKLKKIFRFVCLEKCNSTGGVAGRTPKGIWRPSGDC